MLFTKGPSLNFTYEQIEDLAAQLPPDEQVKLARKLDKDLARKRLRELFAVIRPKKPVRDAEILKVSKEVRKRVATRYRRDAAAGDR